jgi:hypothetical protein
MNKETKYLDYLIDITKRDVLLLKHKRNLIYVNNLNNKNTNEKYKSSNIFSNNNNENLMPDIEEIANIVKEYETCKEQLNNVKQNEFKIDSKNITEKEEIFRKITKEENKNVLFNEETNFLFNELNNHNKTNFEILQNKNFNLRKDSFMTNFSFIEEMNIFNNDNNIFE